MYLGQSGNISLKCSGLFEQILSLRLFLVLLIVQKVCFIFGIQKAVHIFLHVYFLLWERIINAFGLSSRVRLQLVIKQVCNARPLKSLARGVEEFLLLFQSYCCIAFISKLFFRKLKVYVFCLWSE